MATELEEAYKTLKVLVVEDDDEMRRLVCRMLERLGVTTVFQARDGSSGFAEAVKSRPDVVLCDVHMAPVDGQGFLKLMREGEDERARQTPIVFLSGDSMLDTVRLATQRHVDGYMVKPVTRDELKKQLDIIITRLSANRKN